ncbi:MAG: ABC transporter permease [Alphaproteobacteria bacterium]|nr:ABC transporter permease [Alphaproteobacteria bacterium]
MNPIAALGAAVLGFTHETGRISVFFFQALAFILRLSIPLKQFFKQAEKIGFNSLPIVILTAFFTGGVLTLQSYNGIGSSMLANSQLGRVVTLSMLRELGPVLASLMVAGRVGAAIAAELGTMRVTEQIDALITLATNPIRYLVVPRIVACALMMPLLVTLANVVGIGGGYLVATHIIGMNGTLFLESAFNGVGEPDIVLGLVKAFVFGTIIGLMGTYQGFHTRGGAEGVGRATTVAVVFASVAILVSDYFITALFISAEGSF